MSSGIRAGKAYMELSLRDSQFRRGLAAAAQQADSWGRGILRAGAALSGLASAGAAAFTPAIQAAADSAEILAKFDTVFEGNTEEMRGFADEMAKTLGRSKSQIQQFLAGSQDLFVPLGFDTGTAEQLSKTITQLAVDLASFNNQADADSMRDIQAALTGSGEVMKKYGVIVSEAAVEQELLNQGINANKASEQAKVLARLAIILRGTTAAQGDAVRNSGSFANAMKRLFGSANDALVAIGKPLTEALAPMVTALAQGVENIGAFIAANSQLVGSAAKLLAIVGGLGAGLTIIGGLLLAGSAVLGSYGAAMSAAAAAMSALVAAAAGLATPFGLAVAAIVAAGAALVDWSAIATKAFDVVRDRVATLSSVFDVAMQAIRNALAAGDIQAAANVLWTGLRLLWAEGTNDIRQMWIDVVGGIQVAGIRAFTALKIAWINTAGAIAESIAFLSSGFLELAARMSDLVGLGGDSLRRDAESFAQAVSDLRTQRGAAADAARSEATSSIDAIFRRGADNLDQLRDELTKAKADFDAAVSRVPSAVDQAEAQAAAGPGLTTEAIDDLVAKFAAGTGNAVQKVLQAASTFRGDLAGRQLGGPVSVEQQQLGELRKQTRALEELVDKAADGLAFE